VDALYNLVQKRVNSSKFVKQDDATPLIHASKAACYVAPKQGISATARKLATPSGHQVISVKHTRSSLIAEIIAGNMMKVAISPMVSGRLKRSPCSLLRVHTQLLLQIHLEGLGDGNAKRITIQ
jgi:hypothetical protein